MLPLCDIFVQTAIRTKCKRIQNIIMLDMKFDTIEIPVQFIIIPNLITSMIIGSDITNNYYGMKIDFNYKSFDENNQDV